MHMINTNFSKHFIQKQLSLDIQESKCVLIQAIYFLGFLIKETKKEFTTLLQAENSFDELCINYERLGYDRTD